MKKQVRKPQTRSLHQPLSLVRPFKIHVRFTPNGPDTRDREEFMEFWTAASERIQTFRSRVLVRAQREQRKLHDAMDKLSPLIHSVLRGEREVAGSEEEVEKLVPDEDLRRKVFEQIAKWLNKPADNAGRSKEDPAKEQLEIRRLEKISKATDRIHKGLITLWEASLEGDAEAAEELAESATLAAVLLAASENAQPEVLKGIAQGSTHWPVLARSEPGWEKDAVGRVANLDLGLKLRMFHARFQRLQGTDANLPARRWAKAAVRVAEETKWRLIMFGKLIDDFGSTATFADFCVSSGWEMGDYPGWLKSVSELRTFSKQSLPEWKPMVREIIRDQVGDFHLLPEWTTQRNTAESNGKTSKGEIQNAILDDIVSALARLAPDASC